jgi:hypothetical protein
VTKPHYRSAAGVFIVFDLTYRESFTGVLEFFRLIEQLCPPTVRVMLVGSKADLESERVVSADEGRALANAHGAGFAEISCATGFGVQEAMSQMQGLLQIRLSPDSCRLLWRGSRHGFSSAAFHCCCDNSERTLTLIRDRNGNIFGGFAIPSWESRLFPKLKGDVTLQGCLFTLKNPHGLTPQLFELIPDRRSAAIKVSSRLGPCFGDGDLVVCDGCNVNASNARLFGSTYANATGIEGRLLFTGSETFTVDEIEVFSLSGPV